MKAPPKGGAGLVESVPLLPMTIWDCVGCSEKLIQMEGALLCGGVVV